MIKQMRLINCQSWKDSTINFADGKLNIVRAPNNAGKSVLFKMLKISASPNFFTREKRKDVIRWGSDCAQAIYLFEDGCIGAVSVYTNQVLYMFKEADSDVWQKSLTPSTKMIEELGFLVSDNGKFIANIIDEDQNLLLIDSDSKNTIEFISMLCINPAVDECREKVKTLTMNANEDLTRVDSRLLKVSDALDKIQYLDVNAMQNKVNELMLMKSVMYDLISLAKKSSGLQDGILFCKDYDTLESLAEVLSLVESIHLQECDVGSFDLQILELCELLCELETINLKDLQSKFKNIPTDYVDILENLEKINLIDLEIPKKIPDIEMVDLLESLEKIKLIDLQTMTEPPASEIADALQSLELIKDKCEDAKHHLRIAAESYEYMKKLEADFTNSGIEHRCEIYGKVIFDGQNCVPFDS